MAKNDVQVRVRDFGQVLPPEVRVAILKRAAAHAIGIIKRRTEQGVDVDGAAFKAYSPAYAKLRAGSGRNVDPVDLTLAGDMLASMTVLDVTPERALIGFQGSSTAYQFQRLRTKKGTPTSKKTRTGRATHALARKPSRKPVANAVKAAAIDRGLGKNPVRHFFGLSADERREVLEEAARAVQIRK
jgi:hypothetical protein